MTLKWEGDSVIREDGTRFELHEAHPGHARCENCLDLVRIENINAHSCLTWWDVDMSTFDMDEYLTHIRSSK